jgi:hypothetical protein
MKRCPTASGYAGAVTRKAFRVKVRGAHELDVHPDDCAERRRMIDAGEGEPE